MAREQGSFKESHYATLANALTGLDAWLGTVDTAVGTATTVLLNVSINVYTENAGGDLFTQKFTASLTATTDANMNNQTAHLITDGITAIVADSGYTTVNRVEVSATCTMSN